MEPFKKLTGVVAPLTRVNVDTDQIIPKQFLKRIERTGFGEFAFFDWRYLPDGRPNPDFELNQRGYQNPKVLVAGREFGFRAIIAPSFADIFYNNCIQNGVLPVVLPEGRVRELMRRAQEGPGCQLTVDLEQQALYDGQGFRERFDIDPFVRERLLHGLDDIALTLKSEERVSA